jgi:hypothetical protein
MGEELEPKSVLPIGIAERQEVAALGRPGIVDQNIQPAKFTPSCLDQLPGRGRLAQIERHDGGLAALVASRCGDVVEGTCIPAGHHDIAALFRKCQRDAPADAAARAGDESNFSS